MYVDMEECEKKSLLNFNGYADYFRENDMYTVDLILKGGFTIKINNVFQIDFNEIKNFIVIRFIDMYTRMKIKLISIDNISQIDIENFYTKEKRIEKSEGDLNNDN